MDSFDLVNTPPSHTIHMLSRYLAHLVESQDKIPNQHLTRFHARAIPAIDVFAYLNRILKYAPCGNECFIAAIVYMERMADPNSAVNVGNLTPFVRLERARNTRNSLIVNSYNIHRLLITGIMVAVKFLSDVFFTNMHVSRVGGLPVQELNQLEIEFLLLNDFNLCVSLEELQDCANRILATVSSLNKLHDSVRSPPPGGQVEQTISNAANSMERRRTFPIPKRFMAGSDSGEFNVQHLTFMGIPRDYTGFEKSNFYPNSNRYQSTIAPKCFPTHTPSPEATDVNSYYNFSFPRNSDEGINFNSSGCSWIPKKQETVSWPNQRWQFSNARNVSWPAFDQGFTFSQPQQQVNYAATRQDCSCGYQDCQFNRDSTPDPHRPMLCSQFDNFSKQQSFNFLSPISPTQKSSTNPFPSLSKHQNIQPSEGYILPPLNSVSPHSYSNILTPQPSEAIPQHHNLPSLSVRSFTDHNPFDFNNLHHSYCPTPSTSTPRYSALYPCSCVACTRFISDTNPQSCECAGCCTSEGKITMNVTPQSYFNEFSHMLASDKRTYINKPYHLVLPPLTGNVMREPLVDCSSNSRKRKLQVEHESIFKPLDNNDKRTRRRLEEGESSNVVENRQRQIAV